MILIIYIALGIVLAVVILAYLREIVALGLIFLGGIIAIIVVVAIGAYLYSLFPSAKADQQSEKNASSRVPHIVADGALSPPLKTKKKYLVVVPSDSDSEQIYEIEAAEEATAQELQAAANVALKGRVAWLKVTVMSDDANVYADISKVVRLDNVVEISWLMDYQFSIRPPKDHSSVKMQIAHDCSHRQMQILRAHQFHNYMGRSGGGSKIVSQVAGWSPIPTDGSQLETMWKFACR